MKNNKFKILFLILSFTLGQSVYAQYFFKSYDLPPYGTRLETGRSLERNSSGWSIAGFSNSTPNAGGYDWLYLKLDAAGNPVCTRLFGFMKDDSCFSHVVLNETARRNVLAGFYLMPDTKEKASWTMIDSNCNHIMSKQISDTAAHQWRQVVTDPYANFALAGYIRNYMGPTLPSNKILAARYTPAGVMSWGFKYITPGLSSDEAYSLCYQSVDGSYAITGRTNFYTVANFEVFILKLSPAGLPIWSKVYHFPVAANSFASRIIPMTDGGFVVAGWTNAYDPAANDVWIFRVNAAGAVVWSMVYGMPGITEKANSIINVASNGTLTFTGVTTSAGNEDILNGNVTAAAGAPVWFKRYNNIAGTDRGYDLKLNGTMSPTYGFTGQLFAAPSTSLDPYMMYTDGNGQVNAGCLDSLMLQPRPVQHTTDSLHFMYEPVQDLQIQPVINNPVPAVRQFCLPTGINGNNSITPEAYELMQNYPNPFNPSTIIKYSIPAAGNVKLTVYNTAGELVATLIDNVQQAGVYQMEFDASSLASGIYFYKLETDGFTDTKKMMLIK